MLLQWPQRGSSWFTWHCMRYHRQAAAAAADTKLMHHAALWRITRCMPIITVIYITAISLV